MERVKPTAEDERLAVIFHALGNSTRLALLRYIACHPGCICNDLVLRFGRAQATMSQHLALLRQAHLIHARREGNATCYWLDHEQLDWIHHQLAVLDVPHAQQGATAEDSM